MAALRSPLINPLLAATVGGGFATWSSFYPSPDIFAWDVLDNPYKALYQPANQAVLHYDLMRPAVCSYRRSCEGDNVDSVALVSLVLVFRHLPMQIEIAHAPPRAPSRSSSSYSDSSSSSFESAASSSSIPASTSLSQPLPVTVWDVLEGLYRGLRAPILQDDVAHFTSSRRRTLQRAVEARGTRVFTDDLCDPPALRRSDFLGRRRRFMGIRPAVGEEVLPGRRAGEVFVVEVSPVTSTLAT